MDEILKLANEKGKFALELDVDLSREQQRDFEAGIDGDLFRLVDVSSIKAYPHQMFRIFKLTPAGQRMLDADVNAERKRG